MRAVWKRTASLLAAVGIAALAAAVMVGSGAFPGPSRAEAAVLEADASRDDTVSKTSTFTSDPATDPAPAPGPVVTPPPAPVIEPLPAPPAEATRPARKKPAEPVYKGAWRTARVSWYGPRFYGHTMAGGGNLRPTTMVVAHRSMKFGTLLQIEYKGRRVVAVVNDRGPYVGGRTFDLGPGVAKKLKFGGVGKIKWRVIGHQKGPLRPKQR
ncbi:MAG: hypothetical protein C0418_02995 [Coriobacteriaceae bacterium]|nr:hypothetical protein [Coriobacteriaceae bacterium]